ncbi:unnamed protein product (macronuclear) [Paramecium tetraurelia]|uniref:Ubiquitin-like protease family profile domain-containing protein n=1 Tax=Paramecium tetraurelia TaxID=5888 RepID=A0CF56_PARTE|nr:uncharacterized protein GSPATT00037862001 [Paramecium tetraurelia]CAK69423.1 unnamed protein product [Paramecium tetraurelia]|eukprot:XP_001436820.1 hypothetical protein (macronuclear) [Paramecium tetraurelia strain d4-2]
MKLEQNEEKFDHMQNLKQSSLYRNFSGLQLEIKKLYLKLFEQNIQESVQQQNQPQIEVSQSYIEYINSEYQTYLQDLKQQDIQISQYQIEQTFFQNQDQINPYSNGKNYQNDETKSQNKVIKFINEGNLDLYQQSNLFKETVQTDIIKHNDKVIMRLKMFWMITITDEQEIVQERFPYYLKFKNENNNYKYNQNISDPEFRILSTYNMLLNTNIIDGYMNYLQIQDELRYFSLPSRERKNYQRLIIFPSSLIANCTLKQFEIQDQEHVKRKFICLFLEHIKQFSAIQYKFWLIYKKIGIVINSSNFHWQFLEVKVDERLLILYDSMFNSLSYKVELFFNTVFQTLTKDQYFKFEVLNKKDFPKQKDGSSCGYYTCIAANYLSQFQNNSFLQYKFLQKMRQELLDLFFPDKKIEKNDFQMKQSNQC